MTITTTLQRCTRCGMPPDALIHHATANGHDFTADRPTFPICPSWCQGHAGAFQGWEERADGSGRTRDHSSRGEQFGNVSVLVNAVEREGGTQIERPNVEVWVDFGQSADLTEAQAHELGLALVRAGDTIRRSQ